MVQVIASVLVGWVSGVLVNYLADVLPHYRSYASRESGWYFAVPHCRKCEQRWSWGNYLLLPRRCHHCDAFRPIRVWIVEVFFIGFSFWLWHFPAGDLGYPLGLLVALYLGLVAVIDLEHRLILHPVSLVGGILGLGVGSWQHGVLSTLQGGVAGFGLMLILYFLGILFARVLERVRGEPSEEVALGFGDVNLSGVLGLLLGWPGVFAGLSLAIVLAGAVSFLYLAGMLVTRRYRMFTAIPYGPFLVASAVILLYFRDLALGVLP